MSSLSTDEITIRAQDLLYQVAYAFYDAPYLILIKLLVQLGVASERRLAELVGISPNELRKYLGTLQVHRLIKRYVNKEKQVMTEFQARHALKRGDRSAISADGKPATRVRDVIYYYLDYREFADVVKYRLAMMRREIDEKIKQEVGHRGYICPNCQRTYDPLSISNLFNPSSNTFNCETCGTELVEYDPYADHEGNTNQDKMQAFNIATAPIRDALKALEGQTIPSLNIVAWLAKNVVSVIEGEDGGEGGDEPKFTVHMGEDEKELLERERLQEAQRVQNALPVWHTHSTVTGTATTLGLANQAKSDLQGSRGANRNGGPVDDEDAMLEQHYAQLEDGDEDQEDEVYGEIKDEPQVSATASVVDVTTPEEAAGGGVMVKVNGIEKPMDDITDEDQELMTPEEYQAYYEAAGM